MKKLLRIYYCLLIAIALTSCGGQDISSSTLEAGFKNTPEDVKTSVYWYWISNHISREGVAKDLHAMKEAGIGRAYIGNIGLTDSESGEGPVKFGSDEWWAITHTALKTATELGIEIGIFNCPGWSQSGGPWVKPEQAMRYLATTNTPVKGGGKVSIALPKPDGKYTADFQDVKVMAYPATNAAKSVFMNPVLSRLNNTETAKEFTFEKPFTLRSIQLYMTTVPVHSMARLEVKEQGNYRILTEFPIIRFNPALNVGFDPYAPIVLSVPATTAQAFRLVVTHLSPGSGVEQIELSSSPVVERYPEKTLAKMFQAPLPYWHEYMWQLNPATDDPSLVVDPKTVIDISDFFDGNTLNWDAPAGDWIVMRSGMLPTGVTNSPARPEAEGLETDKMSKQHIKAHFEAFLGEIHRRIPAEDRACWKIVVEDSYETGGQNFTDTFIEDFETRYGYSALPFLPVYEGVVVGSVELSDRFLWDMRRLVADKVAYDYVAGLREVSHKYGLTTWLENYGHWGFPGEFLQYGGQSDEIAGEFWSEGALGDIENRAASSCGHIYGKNKIYAESFTAGGGGYHRYPAMMKQRGDRFFTEGINSTLLHLVISQPYEEREPGVNATFANEFNRKNTWYPHLHLFIEYIKRANYMLQQGLNIADAAYFIGEDAPKMTGVTDPEVPKGYQFDYINAEVLIRDAFVKEGLLTLPHGTQYRILVLPKLETMRPELLTKLEKLIVAGAVVLGPAPKRSPSLENYPEADAQVAETASGLWSQINPITKYAKIGKGMLIEGMDMTDAFALIGCAPDMSIAKNEPLLYGHRKVGDKIDIYLVSNQDQKSICANPVFRVKGKKPELWCAITGEIRDLPSYTETADGTMVPIKLDTYQSAFIVFRTKGKAQNTADLKLNFPTATTVKTVDNPWIVEFETNKRGAAEPLVMEGLYDLTQSDIFDIKHYSGMLVYNNTFVLESLPEGQTEIDLGALTAMAKVWVNGQYVGGVWTPPYKVDITDYLIQGENKLKIEVTTTWMNRLIGDLKLPESQRKTWVAFQPWSASSPLQPTGLMGPVSIQNTIYSQKQR